MILGLKRATSQPQRRSSLCASSVARSGPFLAVGHLFECRWITVSVDRDLLGGSVKFAKIIRSEFDINRSDILLKTLQLRRAGNGNDPRFLCQEPSECDLSRSRILLCGESCNQIHQSL